MELRPFPRREADDSFKMLRATPGAHGQFSIENGEGFGGDEFEAQYVHLSGYCGPHNPNVFAAAPELLGALETAEPLLETMHSLMLPAGRRSKALKAVSRELNKVRAAIAKAKGEVL